MRLVKTDLRGLNSLQIYFKGKLILKRMTDNPHFPNPTPSLAELGAELIVLQQAYSEARNGGKRAFLMKDIATAKVANLIKAMANYVASVAQGDQLMVGSAGLDMRKRSKRINVLDRPKRINARTQALPGQVALRWSPVKGARMYQVFIGNYIGDAMTWQPLAVSSGSRCVIKGLESCKYHYFCVKALGASGESPLSQSASALAA